MKQKESGLIDSCKQKIYFGDTIRLRGWGGFLGDEIIDETFTVIENEESMNEILALIENEEITIIERIDK